MPQQPGHSRFRPEDLTTRPVSRFRDLGAMTLYLESLLMRINEQREEIESKLVEFEALERDQRARALREIKDNYKELLTGAIRHGSQPSVFQLGPQGATLERGLGHVLFGESLPVKWTSCCCIVLLTRHCCAGCVEQQRVRTQPSSR